MRQSKYFICLSDEEIAFLRDIIDDPKSSKTRRSKAEILLGLNGRRPSYTVIDNLAFTYGVSKCCVSRLIAKYTTEGAGAVKKAPNSTPRRHYKVTDEIKDRILSWLQTPPPRGKHKWSAYAIADKIVEEGMAEKMSYQTIYRWLEQMNIKV